MTAPLPPDKPTAMLLRRRPVLAMAAAGCLAALTAALPGDAWAVALAAVVGAASVALGVRLGAEQQARETRLRLYRVADELVQYRAFTRLLRAQGDRISGLTGEAALALAEGLKTMDDRAAAVADRLGALGHDQLRAEAVAITEPMVDMVGKLQFQDVTQQQLGFLARLSLILDDHMAELSRLLGDRRSLDRTSHFKELFDQALNDTVMTSQRNDHHSAAGMEFFESSGPAIELFADTGETR